MRSESQQILLKRGAEADIYRIPWRSNSIQAILKIRRPKPYRNPVLDIRIRKQRTTRESQTIHLARSFGIPVPIIYFVDPVSSSIIMQEIPGVPVHDLLPEKIVELSKTIGTMTGILHKNGVMHGDLTTSNFILYRDRLYMLDFGLSQNTIKPQDHAVDLRLIKEIFNSAHAPIMDSAWSALLSGYNSSVGSTTCEKIIDLVSQIESRGRYATVV